MSTKIYTGFAFEGRTLATTLELLGRQRTAVQALVDAKNCKGVARRASRIIDDYCIARPQGGPHREELEVVKAGAYSHAVTAIEAEQYEGRKSQLRHPLTDCDVLIRLFLDFESQQVIGFVCEERVGVLGHLLALPGVVPFSYWNNVDPDESVSPEAWEIRGAVWDRVFTAEGGCEFSMSWQPQFAQLGLVASHLPSFEVRVESRSRDAALEAYVGANWVQSEPGSTRGLVFVASAARKALEEHGSVVYADYLAARDLFSKTLFPDLTPHLHTPLAGLPEP